MIQLDGKYNSTIIYTDAIEPSALSQVYTLLNDPALKDTTIRIMPDVHAGQGIPIGTSIQLPQDRSLWKVAPDIVSSDIHCSMTTIKLTNKFIDILALERIARHLIPTGMNHHKQSVRPDFVQNLMNQLTFEVPSSKEEAILNSFGTLGGGNHFIELSKDQSGYYWLTIHTGSRSFGSLVHQHHVGVARQIHKLEDRDELLEIINDLKRQKRFTEIQTAIDNFKPKRNQSSGFPYLTGKYLDDYTQDLEVTYQYAQASREWILTTLAKVLNLDIIEMFTSPHNYFDTEKGIIRKGATDASDGRPVLIPINMRDGIYLGYGLGNPDWNHSAPHGAGRVYSRSKAREVISLEDFQKSMEGVYSTSITQSNVDESPFAYKSADDIIPYLTDSVEITHHLQPLWSFKA